MAKAVVPVSFVKYPEDYEFPLSLYELFDDLKIFDPVEDFTFTGRVDLSFRRDRSSRKEVLALRRDFQRRLKGAVPDLAARRRLLKWFKSNDWNVSFFVDCY